MSPLAPANGFQSRRNTRHTYETSKFLDTLKLLYFHHIDRGMSCFANIAELTSPR